MMEVIHRALFSTLVEYTISNGKIQATEAVCPLTTSILDWNDMFFLQKKLFKTCNKKMLYFIFK